LTTAGGPSSRTRGWLGEALALYALTLLALVTIAPQLSARWGLGGVLASEVALVLLPTAAWLRARPVSRAELGLADLRVPQVARALGGGALIGAGACWLLALGVALLLDRWLKPTPEVRQSLERLILPLEGARSLWIDLAALALVPAIAEELLFRGVLYGVLAERMRAFGAVAVTALAFALYHASAYRFAPAALAGLLLGGVRVWSGSLLAAIACHAANNLTVIALARAGRAVPSLSWAPLAAALVAIALGFLLTFRRPVQRS
jgi:membrane protease YdiL (CAAX protease family)